MDVRKNERVLWQAFHVTRAMAQLTEACLINPLDADSHIDTYHAKLLAVLDGFSPSDLFELSDDLDVMHSEHRFSREAKERKIAQSKPHAT